MIEVPQPQTAPDGVPRVGDVCGLDLVDTATWANGVPHDALDTLRAAAPVAWQDEKQAARRASQLNSGQAAPYSPGYFAVTSHALVDEVSRNSAVFSSALGGTQLRTTDQMSLAGLRLNMLNMDAPHHLRLRKIVTPTFSPRSVGALREYVVESARELAAGLAGSGTVDLVEAVSKELTARVLARILGMPLEDRYLIIKWSDALIGFEKAEQTGDIETTFAMRMELFEYGRRVLAAKRANPTDDLASQIANAVVEGERLTDEEFCFFWILLVIAGNETTRNSISGSVLALQTEDAWGRLATQAEPISPTAVEELIRYVTPVIQFRRTATTDVTLGGQSVRAGDKVVIYYSSANRDPAVFAEPHRLDLSRDPNPHLAFGIGPHFCLGTRVARLQLSAILNELLVRYPRLKIDGDVEWTQSTFISGIDHLPVRLG